MRNFSITHKSASGNPLAGVPVMLRPDNITTSASSVVSDALYSTRTATNGYAALPFIPSAEINDTTYTLWIGPDRWDNLTLPDEDIDGNTFLRNRQPA